MASRFRFHGYAIGAAGRVGSPCPELIEVQAATALPQIGGHGTARSVSFRFQDILQFDLAHSEVSGTYCKSECDDEPPSFRTRLMSTVEGLNILDMITADRIVATLTSTYTAASNGEPTVRLLGTRFENLKIAGIPIELDLCTDVFDSHETHSALAEAFKTDEKVRALIEKVSLKDRAEEAPPHILHWFHPCKGDELPASRGITPVSLVRGLKPASGGLDCWGHVIHIAGFGTIRLAEVDISRLTRTVNMLQLALECPHKAMMMFCSVSDGGEDY